MSSCKFWCPIICSGWCCTSNLVCKLTLASRPTSARIYDRLPLAEPVLRVILHCEEIAHNISAVEKDRQSYDGRLGNRTMPDRTAPINWPWVISKATFAVLFSISFEKHSTYFNLPTCWHWTGKRTWLVNCLIETPAVTYSGNISEICKTEALLLYRRLCILKCLAAPGPSEKPQRECPPLL